MRRFVAGVGFGNPPQKHPQTPPNTHTDTETHPQTHTDRHTHTKGGAGLQGVWTGLFYSLTLLPLAHVVDEVLGHLP